MASGITRSGPNGFQRSAGVFIYPLSFSNCVNMSLGSACRIDIKPPRRCPHALLCAPRKGYGEIGTCETSQPRFAAFASCCSTYRSGSSSRICDRPGVIPDFACGTSVNSVASHRGTALLISFTWVVAKMWQLQVKRNHPRMSCRVPPSVVAFATLGRTLHATSLFGGLSDAHEITLSNTIRRSFNDAIVGAKT